MKIEKNNDMYHAYLDSNETIVLLDAWREFYIFSYEEPYCQYHPTSNEVELIAKDIIESIIDGYPYKRDYPIEFQQAFSHISKGKLVFGRTYIIPDKKTVQSYGIESVIAMKYL